MKPRILLLSTVHPATDPRILYKIGPSLSPFYSVFCALPNASSETKVDGITMIRLPAFKNLIIRILISHPVTLWKCMQLRPDVLHIFVPELIPVALLYHYLGVKVIYDVQENHFKKFGVKKYNNSKFFQAFFKYFDLIARKKFYCIFTEDAYLKEYSNLAQPFEVVHNYADPEFIDSLTSHIAPCSGVPAFLYTGVISMERSFDTLIAALAILRIHQPAFHVHLFGPVRFGLNEAEKLPDFQNVKDHLTFHGYTDLRLIIPYANKCVAGIALLKPVGDYPDSYTTKLFEYMALKLPVITSDFPLYQNVIDNARCGFCISPYNALILADTLSKIIIDKKSTFAMGKNGRKAVETYYNWKNEEKILLSFYKKIINS